MAASSTAYSANDAYGGNGARRFEPPSEEEAHQGVWVCGGTPLPAQLWAAPPGGDAPSGGFCQDGVLDRMPAGPDLGLLLPSDMAGLGDEELTGVLRGWRRMGSWAAAMEHAAAAELARRRIAEAQTCGARGDEVPRYAAAEVAAALTLTSRSADGLMGRAIALAALPATWAALAAGRIDVPKALVILNGVSCLGEESARAVEAQVVAGAGEQTTGELRKAVAQAVIAADPAAADRRVAEAQKSARVERWAEPCGTVAIAGRDLPPADALAADNRINALAAALKTDGAPGGIDLLRAQVFLGLLLDRPVAAPAQPAAGADYQPSLQGRRAPQPNPAPQHNPAPERSSAPSGGTAASDGGFPVCSGAAGEHRPAAEGGARAGGLPAGSSPGAEDVQADRGATTGQRPAAGTTPAKFASATCATCGAEPTSDREPMLAGLRRVPAGPGHLGPPLPPGGGWAGMAGSVNLIVPLRALLGQSSQPAEVAGFGPITPTVTREILTAARHSRAMRWCVTVTDADGRSAGHGCATPARGGPAEPGGWGFTLTVRTLETDDCGHARQSAAYKPPPLLRHLIQTRHRTCTAPGCGRPAGKCDLDHTIPYDEGGLTCECNLAPLCRFHHKAKQAEGWKLIQHSPGTLQWVTPSGWRYTIMPSQYPI